HAIPAAGPRGPAGENAFDEVLAFVPEGLLSWKRHYLSFFPASHRQAVQPIDPVRIDRQLTLAFYVIEDRHFLSANDNQPLLFEGMEPTDEDVRLHAALEFAGRQSTVID